MIPLRILQVGALETGGAASVAGNLLRSYRSRGSDAWMAVGRRANDDSGVFQIPDDDGVFHRRTGYTALQQQLGNLAERAPGSGWGLLSRSIRFLTHPQAAVAQARGIEDFDFPGTYSLLDLAPARPNVVHCHNLHGGYFDLRALAWLSRQVPTVLTLHDAWLLSGHCAHSFDCERWTSGCGACPDLTIYPSIRRDATSVNWHRKRDIFAKSRLYVSAPSKWLMDKIDRSMLAPAVQLARVIPNGVDRSIFERGDKRTARLHLGIDPDAAVVLLMLGRRDSPWVDRAALQAVMNAVGSRSGRRRVIFAMVGDGSSAIQTTNTDVRSVEYQHDPEELARYYQAADVYLHCARTGTFPNTILEALACGTPVVAFAVGGIPEQIRSGETGTLVVPGDSRAMAASIVALVDDEAMHDRFALNAVDAVRARFDLQQQVECYLAWYRTIIEHWTKHVRAGSEPTPTAAAG